MADLVPHPLVTRVGQKFVDKGLVSLPAARTQEPEAETSASASAKSARVDNEVAGALADQANLPDLSLFAGFLGGPVSSEKNPGTWRLVYLDSRLNNWLLVPEDDIIVWQRLEDDHAPSGLRDALWVTSSAMVVRGSGARSNEGRFLVGEFTRAADFAAATTGGTFSAATGLLCEATTPGCCWGSRSR